MTNTRQFLVITRSGTAQRPALERRSGLAGVIIAVGLAIASFAGAYSASSARVAPSEPGTFQDERSGSPSILVPLY